MSAVLTLDHRKIIQLQTMRLSSLNSLQVASRLNVLLTNEEAECGAVTTDDLGKTSSPLSLSCFLNDKYFV